MKPREPKIIPFDQLHCAENLEKPSETRGELHEAQVGDFVQYSETEYKRVTHVDPETLEPFLVPLTQENPDVTRMGVVPTHEDLLQVTYDDIVAHSEVINAAAAHPDDPLVAKAMYTNYGIPHEWLPILHALYTCLEGGRDVGPGSVSFDWRINVLANMANGGHPEVVRANFRDLLAELPGLEPLFDRLVEQGRYLFYRRSVIQNTQESITSLLATFFSIYHEEIKGLRTLEHNGQVMKVLCTSKDDRRMLHPILAMILDLVDLTLWNRYGGLSYLLGSEANSVDELGYYPDYLGEIGEVEFPAAFVLSGEKGIILLSPPTRN